MIRYFFISYATLATLWGARWWMCAWVLPVAWGTWVLLDIHMDNAQLALAAGDEPDHAKIIEQFRTGEL